MKNSINLSYDSDKLSALEMFMKQKNLDLDSELLKQIDSLYQKNVPQNVRDFIEIKGADKPKKAVKSAPKAEVNGDD